MQLITSVDLIVCHRLVAPISIQNNFSNLVFELKIFVILKKLAPRVGDNRAEG